MQLGIYYSSKVYFDRYRYYTNRPLNRYVEQMLLTDVISKVVLFAPVHPYKGEGYALPEAIEVVKLPRFSSYITALPLVFGFWRCFKKNLNKVDIVWIRFPAPFGWLLARLAEKAGKRVFWQIAGDPSLVIAKGTKYKGLTRILARIWLSLEERLLKQALRGGLCFLNGKELYERYGEMAQKAVQIVTSSLTEDDFLDRDAKRISTPTEILFVGYLRHEKGIPFLLQATQKLLEKGYALKMTIVGDGPEKDMLQRLTKKMEIGKQVAFQGSVSSDEEMQAIYSTADLFVLPSISEGTPRVLLEAMAAGLPIVATKVGGIPDIIEDGENGILVPPGDAGALAKAIQKVLINESLRRNLVAKGRKFAETHTVKTMISHILRVLEEENLLCRKE